MFCNKIIMFYKRSKRDFFISNQQRMLVEEEVKKLREKISDLKVENINVEKVSSWKILEYQCGKNIKVEKYCGGKYPYSKWNSV